MNNAYQSTKSGKQIDAAIDAVKQHSLDIENILTDVQKLKNSKAEIESIPQKTGDLTDNTTEQNYNPESENPQSGKAVAEAIAKLLGSAPENLDTLEELAKALDEDENFSATVLAEIAKKVDKVEGKGLSSNDYTDEDKIKLTGIEVGANKTVVDSKLSETSTNPVQNKVTLEALNGKADSIINTALGETIQLTDSAGEKLKGLNVYGKTTQADTPSVENPVALESIGDDGSVDLIVCSKNVLKFPYANTTVTKNGITWKVNSDGSITANGTATANSGFTLANYKNIAFGTYTFSVNYSDTSNVSLDTIFAYIYVGNTYLSVTSKRTFTIDETPSQFVIVLRVVSGVTVNNLVFKPQLEFGTANTDYEMFKGIQSFVLSTPNGLCGIPVSSGGNYTDSNGQQWICDEVDFDKSVYIQRIDKLQSYNGEIITTPYMSTTGELSNGATVVYVLDNPIEITLTEEQISAYKALQTYKPTTIITNDEHAYMKVDYVADTKKYIDNKFAELQNAILSTGGNV